MLEQAVTLKNSFELSSRLEIQDPAIISPQRWVQYFSDLLFDKGIVAPPPILFSLSEFPVRLPVTTKEN